MIPKSGEIDQILTARRAIVAELARRFKAGDKEVRAVRKDSTDLFSGGGEMPCPVCGSGKLRYSRASLNGHIHARCTTDGCVAWME